MSCSTSVRENAHSNKFCFFFWWENSQLAGYFSFLSANVFLECFLVCSVVEYLWHHHVASLAVTHYFPSVRLQQNEIYFIQMLTWKNCKKRKKLGLKIFNRWSTSQMLPPWLMMFGETTSCYVDFLVWYRPTMTRDIFPCRNQRTCGYVCTFFKFLIHLADSQSWPVVIIVFTHAKIFQNKLEVKIMFTTEGLAEWIIDDTCLV